MFQRTDGDLRPFRLADAYQSVGHSLVHSQVIDLGVSHTLNTQLRQMEKVRFGCRSIDEDRPAEPLLPEAVADKLAKAFEHRLTGMHPDTGPWIIGAENGQATALAGRVGFQRRE